MRTVGEPVGHMRTVGEPVGSHEKGWRAYRIT